MIITAVKNKNISPADFTMGEPAPGLSRISDFIITHFRAFKKVAGDVNKDIVIDKSFELMTSRKTRFAASTGLIPDFIAGLPGNPSTSSGGRIESQTEGFFAWNACRIPWRLGFDYVTSGDVRSNAHPATGYYDYELQLIRLIVASGNWWDP